MFISVKRHEREKQALLAASNRLTDAILKTSSFGLFLLDSKGRFQPQVSASLATLFRRQDFSNFNFEKLIGPLVSAKTLTVARAHIARLLELARGETADDNPLRDVEVKLGKSDGTFESAHYCFEFSAIETPLEPRFWLVRVSDITVRAQQHRELEDLRIQAAAQGEILRSVLKSGGARFGTFLQKTQASMKTINEVLKKPARETGAFRNKLEETLQEVGSVRRDAAAFRLSELEQAARDFEDALKELRSRDVLSGGDFLPLAVKLDALYGQFALLRTLSSQAGPREPEALAPPEPKLTKNGTEIIEAPAFAAEAAAPRPAPAQRVAAVGSLESTLVTLTDVVAQENRKLVTLLCKGLERVPPRYQATVKNVSIQLIRNAVVHGVERAAERAELGKPATATLSLEFKDAPGAGFELLFQDDGRGLDAQKVREVAVAKGILSAAEASALRDRQAIKLIFKSGFTTLDNIEEGVKHGKGMSLVRRYVHEAGGKIALASAMGEETRFKVTLPALAASPDAQVASPGAAAVPASAQVA